MSHKSLNVWDYKPWWCQPWSIISTGLSLGVGSWMIVGNLWFTTFLAFLIMIWWIYFLIIYPRIVSKILKQDLD